MPIIKCDPRAKARCPFKNPCCGDEVAYFMDGSDCDKFNQSVLAPPPTNADRIRAMSYKELAKLFTHTVADGCPPDMDWKCTKDCDGWDGCDACWERWLQQPAEEG